MTTDQDHGLDPIRLLRELIAAFNRYDLDTAMSFFVEDCIYRTPRGRRPWGRNVTGSADVRAAFERQFGRFQDVEAAAIEKERMIPKQAVQLPDGGMVVGKHLGMELAQGLVYLCRV